MAEQEGQVISAEGLTASLDELVKAADATNVVKAYGGTAVEGSGHTDERGHTEGGLADTGDVGSIESLMIAKMQDTLVDAGFSVDQITAFMHGKQEDEGSEEDEEEDEEEMEGKMGFVPHARPTPSSKKSSSEQSLRKAMDSYRKDSDISDAIDVSPFLEALVSRTAEQLDDIRKSMLQASGNQTGVNRAQAAATYQIGTLVKGIAEVVGALDKRMQLVERQPAPQKGATRLGSRPLHKSIPGEVGAAAPTQLSKSEVCRVLSYMNLEKSIKEVGGQNTGTLACLVEGNPDGSIDPIALQAVYGFLAAHPNEVETARTYR